MFFLLFQMKGKSFIQELPQEGWTEDKLLQEIKVSEYKHPRK